MGKIKSAFSKIGNVCKGFVTYWNKPPKGRYLSYKEAAAYCVGGMGAVGATVIPNYVTLQAGIYIAAALNIAVDHIIIIGIIGNIVNILRAPIYSMLVDNTNTKYGKFRPYLIWMPIPIVICMFAIGWIPQMLTDHYMVMLVVYTIIFQLLQFFVGLYSLAFTTLLQVITPAQGEKEWLMGIGATVYSLGPSLVNMVIPFIGNLLYTYTLASGDKIMGINTVGPFKWVTPIAMIICLALGYWTAFGTKERTATSKQYKQKVNFKHGIVSTAKNKYFWLYTSSSILGTFKLAGTSFVVWLCSYAIQQDWAQSLFVTIMGSACVPGMVLAPLFIKKFGKKNIIIFTNI
ncbi:MAG: MFS transporter, partial [Christensenellales bacterium]